MKQPAPTVERFWIVYCGLVLAVSWTLPHPGRSSAAPYWHLLAHGAVLAVAMVALRIARRDHAAARWWRAGLGIVGLPTVFSAMCWLLPYVHPEPYEFVGVASDRWLLGTDLARLADPILAPWFVEVLHLVYAAYYLIPISAALLAWRGAGPAAFDRAVAYLVGGFLLSYVGYLLVPTLGPNRIMSYPEELVGLWWSAGIRAWVEANEANWWDCFPSGHTMLTLVSLCILWRWHRPGFWLLLVPGALLIASTMLLRFHWIVDVVVGAALVWPTLRGVDALLDRDGWPAAPARRAPAA